MRTVRLTKESTKDILENLLKRSPNNYGKFEATVVDILANVKEKGDEALFSYTKEFDKVEVTPETIRVTEEEIEDAYKAVDASLLEVIRKALVKHPQLSRKAASEQLVYQHRERHHAWTKSNPVKPCRRLCSWRKGSLSIFCTDEYCAGEGCWRTPYRDDHTPGKDEW